MQSKYHSKSSVAGFSLLEILTVIVMIGILSAISIPSWMNFMRRQRVNAAQNEAVQALRVAQASAKKEGRVWQVSFQDLPGTNQPLQLAVHRVGQPPAWRFLPSTDALQVTVDTTTAAKTTLKLNNSTGCGTGVQYCIRFDAQGHFEKSWRENQAGTAEPTGDIGKITFQPTDAPSAKPDLYRECVMAATILGSIRTGEDGDCD